MNKLLAAVTSPTAHTPGIAAAPAASVYRLFVRDLELRARIGIYDHEKAADQRLLLSFDVEAVSSPVPSTDRIADVVSYETLVETARAEVAAGHVNLVETLAERIAGRILADRRVRRVAVRVEKPDALPDCASVGIQLERTAP